MIETGGNGDWHATPGKAYRPGNAYWIVSNLALIWFTMGCVSFIFQMSPDAFDAYDEADQALIRDRPHWATLAFAISVFGGLLGAISLLLRRVIAEKFMLASLLGTMIASGYTLTLGVNPGMTTMIMATALPIGLGIVFFWYTNVSREKGLLR